MLAVSDRREAQKVFFAVQNAAGWTLQLRPVANATDSRRSTSKARARCSRTASPQPTSATTQERKMTETTEHSAHPPVLHR